MEALDSATPNDDFSCLWPDELRDGEIARDYSPLQAGVSKDSFSELERSFLEEIGGLFVGLGIINEIEPLEECHDNAQKNLLDAQKNFLDAEIKKTSLEIYGEQLNVLRILRAKFVVHHRKFLKRTLNHPSQKIQELRRSCRRSRDLLDTGLLTFKAVMTGEHPSTLKEIFAFLSLSFAMVSTMQACGKSVEFYLSRWEVSKWGAIFQDENDYFALLKLIPLLWPEVEDPVRRDNPYSVSDVAWEGFSRDIFTENWPSSDRGCESFMYSTACRLLGETSADENFRFSDWLNLVPVDDTSGLQDNRFSEKFLQIDPLSDMDPQQRQTISQADAENTEWASDVTALAQPSGLAQTALFKLAITFLIFIGGLGVLLFHLGDLNHTGSLTGPSVFTTANIARFSRFLEVTKYRILNPLCLDSSISEFHPLFKTTIKVLEAGWLRTVRDIEIYLLRITKLFAKCRVSYLSAVSKILICALNASQDERIDHECLYQEGHQEVNDYSAEYTSRRTCEEAAAFPDDVATHAPYAAGFDADITNLKDSSTEVGIVDPKVLYQETTKEKQPAHAYRGLPLTKPATSATSATSSYKSSDKTLLSSAPQAALNRYTTLHCPISGCSKRYTGPDSRSNLARHKREQHSDRAAFSCTVPSCGHVSKRLHNLRAHWRLRHGKLTMPEWLGRGRGK